MKQSRPYAGRALGLLVGMLCLAGCYRQDIVTAELSAPGLRGEECAALVTNALMPVAGMIAVRVDPVAQQVSVTYDARLLAYKNVQHLITDLGFEADGRPPDKEQQAVLPEACR